VELFLICLFTFNYLVFMELLFEHLLFDFIDFILFICFGNSLLQFIDSKFIFRFNLLLSFFVCNFELILLTIQLQPLLFSFLVKLGFTCKYIVSLASVGLIKVFFVVSNSSIISFHLLDYVLQ
jgi:hypothetical protein